MSTKIFVFSTLTASQEYRIGDGPETVFIAGGANSPNKQLITPKGVVTAITAEQYAELTKNPVFALHEANGFIKVSDKAADANEVAEDMNPNDPSAPDTPERAAAAAAEAQEATGAERATTVKTDKKK